MIELGGAGVAASVSLKVGDLVTSPNDSMVESGKTYMLVPANGSWSGSADTFPELATALRKKHIKHIAPVPDMGGGRIVHLTDINTWFLEDQAAGKLWKSTDPKKGWTKIAENYPTGGGYHINLTFNRQSNSSATNKGYLFTTSNSTANVEKIFRSPDGVNWTAMFPDILGLTMLQDSGFGSVDFVGFLAVKGTATYLVYTLNASAATPTWAVKEITGLSLNGSAKFAYSSGNNTVYIATGSKMISWVVGSDTFAEVAVATDTPTDIIASLDENPVIWIAGQSGIFFSSDRTTFTQVKDYCSGVWCRCDYYNNSWNELVFGTKTGIQSVAVDQSSGSPVFTWTDRSGELVDQYGDKEAIQFIGGRDDANTVLIWGWGLPWSDPHLFVLENLMYPKFSVPDVGLGEYGKVVAKIV